MNTCLKKRWKKISIVENIFFVLITGSLFYILYKIIRDIVEMKEDRPKVTDAMVEEAYRCQIMTGFDSEYDSIDWEDDD